MNFALEVGKKHTTQAALESLWSALGNQIIWLVYICLNMTSVLERLGCALQLLMSLPCNLRPLKVKRSYPIQTLNPVPHSVITFAWSRENLATGRSLSSVYFPAHFRATPPQSAATQRAEFGVCAPTLCFYSCDSSSPHFRLSCLCSPSHFTFSPRSLQVTVFSPVGTTQGKAEGEVGGKGLR